MSNDVVHGLSLDVEEYFHAINLRPAFPESEWDRLPRRAHVGVDHFLELLERRGEKATFFVLGWLAEREPDLVRKIRDAGHEIGSHGTSHRMAHELGRAGFRSDVEQSVRLLEQQTGERVRGFRASTFSVTRDTAWALDELADLGLDYDSSIFPVRHDRYGVPDFPRRGVRFEWKGRSLVELPLLTLRVAGMNLPAAGGGYLRQFPVGYLRRALRQSQRRGIPGVLYLHPWELDPEQPKAPAGTLGRVARLRHYRNLERTLARLERLLEGFRFGPLGSLADAVPSDDAHGLQSLLGAS